MPIQICWHRLSKKAFDRCHSLLPLILWQRHIHFAICFLLLEVLKHPTLGSILRGRNKLHLPILLLWSTVNSWIIVLLHFLGIYDRKRFLMVAASLRLLKVRLLLRDCLLTSIFVVQLIPLRDLLFMLLREISLFVARTLRTLIFRAVFLQLELFLNIFQVVLIHVREDIIRILTVGTH